jgi:hypothetical protein
MRNSPSMVVGLGLGTGGSPLAVSSTVIGGGSVLARCRFDMLAQDCGNAASINA